MDIKSDMDCRREDVLTYFTEELERSRNLRKEISFDLVDRRIKIIRDKRTFLQNIALVSATLLSFVSVFSSLGVGDRIYRPYIYIGLTMHVLVICFIFIYMRGVLDEDIEGLADQQDSYVETVQNKINLLEEFIGKIHIQGSTSIPLQLVEEYRKRLQNIPSSIKIKVENEENDQQRKLRMAGKKQKEFYAEVVIFMFILGLVFIVLAITGHQCVLRVMVIVSIVFILTFTDFIRYILRPIFKILTFLN